MKRAREGGAKELGRDKKEVKKARGQIGRKKERKQSNEKQGRRVDHNLCLIHSTSYINMKTLL